MSEIGDPASLENTLITSSDIAPVDENDLLTPEQATVGDSAEFDSNMQNSDEIADLLAYGAQIADDVTQNDNEMSMDYGAEVYVASAPEENWGATVSDEMMETYEVSGDVSAHDELSFQEEVNPVYDPAQFHDELPTEERAQQEEEFPAVEPAQQQEEFYVEELSQQHDSFPVDEPAQEDFTAEEPAQEDQLLAGEPAQPEDSPAFDQSDKLTEQTEVETKTPEESKEVEPQLDVARFDAESDDVSLPNMSSAQENTTDLQEEESFSLPHSVESEVQPAEPVVSQDLDISSHDHFDLSAQPTDPYSSTFTDETLNSSSQEVQPDSFAQPDPLVKEVQEQALDDTTEQHHDSATLDISHTNDFSIEEPATDRPQDTSDVFNTEDRPESKEEQPSEQSWEKKQIREPTLSLDDEAISDDEVESPVEAQKPTEDVNASTEVDTTPAAETDKSAPTSPLGTTPQPESNTPTETPTKAVHFGNEQDQTNGQSENEFPDVNTTEYISDDDASDGDAENDMIPAVARTKKYSTLPHEQRIKLLQKKRVQLLKLENQKKRVLSEAQQRLEQLEMEKKALELQEREEQEILRRIRAEKRQEDEAKGVHLTLEGDELLDEQSFVCLISYRDRRVKNYFTNISSIHHLRERVLVAHDLDLEKMGKYDIQYWDPDFDEYVNLSTLDNIPHKLKIQVKLRKKERDSVSRRYRSPSKSSVKSKLHDETRVMQIRKRDLAQSRMDKVRPVMNAAVTRATSPKKRAREKDAFTDSPYMATLITKDLLPKPATRRARSPSKKSQAGRSKKASKPKSKTAESTAATS